LVSLFVVLSAGHLCAQLNLLTPREAERLIEEIPEIVAAQKNGECPDFSPNYEDPEHLAFQVRATCGSTGGYLIGNYTVNRRTGEVTTWGDNPLPLADLHGKRLAMRLIEEARQRVLSGDEAHCLALEAAKSLPNWDTNDAVVSVRQLGNSKTFVGKLLFVASRDLPTARTSSGRLLAVDLATALVRNNETGLNVMSGPLGSLTAKIIQLRAPLWLTDEDANSIALLVPRVARQLRGGCEVDTQGTFKWNQALTGVTCGGNPVEQAEVSINLETGEIADPDTGKPLDAPEAERRARELLSNVQLRRRELKKELEASCPSQ
jgi:hypothetical protein